MLLFLFDKNMQVTKPSKDEPECLPRLPDTFLETLLWCLLSVKHKMTFHPCALQQEAGREGGALLMRNQSFVRRMSDARILEDLTFLTER